MNMRLTHNQLTYRTNVTYAIWTQVLCQWHQIYLTHVLRTRPSSVGTFIVKGATRCVTIAIRLLWFGGCFSYHNTIIRYCSPLILKCQTFYIFPLTFPLKNLNCTIFMFVQIFKHLNHMRCGILCMSPFWVQIYIYIYIWWKEAKFYG
jgi:hypothetical protein